MSESFQVGRMPIEIRAFFLGQRLNLRALEQSKRLSPLYPLVIRTGAEGYAAFFRYGVAVLFSMNALEEAAFIKDIEDFVVDPFPVREVEEGTLIIDKDKPEGAEPKNIVLNHWDVERLQMLADIFAKSVVLSYYEKQMAETFDKLEPVAAAMQTRRGPGSKASRELLRHIGVTLSIQRKMIGHVEIEEKPDMLWERPDLERLYVRLEDEYELSERHNALKHKLDLVYRTAETILGVLQERRSFHVEWYIVILILIEIVISLGEKIF